MVSYVSLTYVTDVGKQDCYTDSGIIHFFQVNNV
jgi:hypothetical protein